MRIIFYEFLMSLQRSIRYRFHFISDAIVYLLLLSFFLMSGTGTSFGSQYNDINNSKTLLLLGYIAWTFSITCIASTANSIGNELRNGTFYHKIFSKMPIQFIYIGSLLEAIFVQVIIIGILLPLIYVIFGVGVYIKGPMILAILITLMGMYGVGLAIGGISLFYKRSGTILFLIQMLLLFLTDTIPTNESLLKVTEFIPLTICNDILRTSYMNLPVGSKMMTLVLSSTLLLIIGNFIFVYMKKKAMKTGNLLQY